MPLGSARVHVGARLDEQLRRRHADRRARQRAAASCRRASAAARPAAARRCGRCPRRANHRPHRADAPSGFAPTRVRASTSAPRASRRFMIAGVVAPRRPHERGVPQFGIAGVDRAPRSSSRSHRVGIPGAHGGHQQCVAGGIGGVHIGAGVEQPRKDRRVALFGRDVDRRDAERVGDGDVRAGAKQRVNGVEVFGAHRPVQRRRAVASAARRRRAPAAAACGPSPVAGGRRAHERIVSGGGRDARSSRSAAIPMSSRDIIDLISQRPNIQAPAGRTGPILRKDLRAVRAGENPGAMAERRRVPAGALSGESSLYGTR